MGKKPKDRRGRLTSPSETSSLRFQFVLPQSPVYGRYPYTFPQNFRRAKYGSGYDFSRATGPWCGAKFWPVPFYRRAWFRPAVAEGAGSGVRRTRPFRKPAGGASPSPTGWMGRYSVEENRRAAFRIIFFDNQFRPAGRTPPSQNSYGGVSSFLYFHSDRSLTSTFRDRFSFLKRLKPYFFNAVLPPNRST